MSEHLLTDLPFARLDLEPVLLQGLEAAEFRYCTHIQAQALPLLLAGRDVAGQAQTGTGKTAAYLLALMNRLLRTHPPGEPAAERPRALVVAPTRELAVQIHKDAETLGRFTGFTFGLVFGGTGYESQRQMLAAGVDILIGTPGRLIDYHKQRVFPLKHIEAVVLDEADRMFDLGFIRDIRFLLRRMPPPDQRLNMLFSATLSLRVQELAYEHMNAPTLIDVTPDQMTVDKVRQVLYHVPSEDKVALLLGLLRHMDATRTLVFVNTKRDGERLEAYLESNGIHGALLSGDVPQRIRLRLLEQFRGGELPILVATDVAARGLHIPDVSHVFNFDLPQDAEDYVHRVGRTARAGKSGDAVSFACERYVYSLPDIEEYIAQKIPVQAVSEELLVRPSPPARRSGRPTRRQHGGGGGDRPRRQKRGRSTAKGGR